MTDERADLLRSADVARLLRVHPKQIYRLLARGLPGHRVGGEWRFSRDEVLAWSGLPAAEPSRAATGSQAPAPTALQTAPPPLLGANGDVVVERLLAQLAERGGPLVGLVQLDKGQSLDRLVARQLLFAGFHGEVPPSHAGVARLARIHLVEREVGLAFRADVEIREVTDLARRRVGTRPVTAGIRGALERALVAGKTSLRALRAEATTYETHRDAVTALLRDEIDVALTTSAWAERAGLRFKSLDRESYDLLLHASDLGSPAAVAVCELAQSAPFRAALDAVAGYDAQRAGQIRYEP